MNMKHYTYVYEKDGAIVRKSVKAESPSHVRSILKARKIFPISIREEKSSSMMAFLTGKNTITPDEVIAFSQLFAGTLRSGLTIKEALRILGNQIENPVMQNRIAEILTDVESGTSLSACFAKHGDVFPNFYPMPIKAGEVSGDLPGVLEYIGTYLERIHTLKKELSGLFTYPAIVTTLGTLLLGVILVYVAPVFSKEFLKMKMQLPIPTQILFAISDVVVNYGLFIVLLITMGIGSAIAAKRTYAGQKFFDRLVISLPMIGKVNKDTMLLRFVKSFDILVNNNVPILQALQVLENGTTNLCLKEIVTQMREDVSRGLPISNRMVNRKDIISPIISYSISMGEKSGNLGPVLTRIGEVIDKDITYSIKQLSARIDPMITLVLGLMVLFVALAIYLPIFDMIAKTSTG